MSTICSRLDSVQAENKCQSNGSSVPPFLRRAYATNRSDAYQPIPQISDVPPTASRNKQHYSPSSADLDLTNLKRSIDQLAQRLNNLPKHVIPDTAVQVAELNKSHSALVGVPTSVDEELFHALNAECPAPDINYGLECKANRKSKLQNSQPEPSDDVDLDTYEIGTSMETIEESIKQLRQTVKSSEDKIRNINRTLLMGLGIIIASLWFYVSR